MKSSSVDSRSKTLPADIRALVEPSKEDVMDYVSAMLFQLAELSDRCGECAMAETLYGLVSGWENRNSAPKQSS